MKVDTLSLLSWDAFDEISYCRKKTFKQYLQIKTEFCTGFRSHIRSIRSIQITKSIIFDSNVFESKIFPIQFEWSNFIFDYA